MVKDTLATNHRLIVMTLPSPEKSNGNEIYKLSLPLDFSGEGSVITISL